MPSTMKNLEEALDVYKEYSTFATPEECHITSICGRVATVRSQWVSRDLVQSSTHTFVKEFGVALDSMKTVIETPPICRPDNIIADVTSATGMLRAVWAKEVKKNTSSHPTFYCQIWKSNRLLRTFDLSAMDVHGDVHSDSVFGSFAWSHAEGHVVYVVQKKRDKSNGYYASVAANGGKTKEEGPVVPGREFEHMDSWGEQAATISEPQIAILDVVTGVISVVENVPGNVSCGSPVWSPGDEGIAFVGTHNSPFRLGHVHCGHRRSGIYYFDLSALEYRLIRGGDVAVCSPRFSPNGASLVWLENAAGGPHGQCQRLMHCAWPLTTTQVTTVIDIVNMPAGGDDFPGIYVWYNLPTRCWSADSRCVFFGSVWRSRDEIIEVDVVNRVASKLDVDRRMAVGSARVLDVHDGYILAAFSSPSTAPYLAISKADFRNAGDSHWSPLSATSTVDELKWMICKHTPRVPHPLYGLIDFESIVLSTDGMVTNQEKYPAIVVAHGGPHWAFTASFGPFYAALCNVGYTVILINHRGSTGFGQHGILSLLGNIGSTDVDDCRQVFDECVECCDVDEARVAVMGRSYGGFVAAHLIGQEPTMFKAAVLHNSPLNLVSMYTSSDVPDWTVIETGISESFEMETYGSISAIHLKTLMDKSPIRHVGNVLASVLQLVGAADLRVPKEQSLQYYKSLKARGKHVRLLYYPEDDHSLSKNAALQDEFGNIVEWLAKHLPTVQ